MYQPLWGDAGLEQAVKCLGDLVFVGLQVPKSPPRYTPKPEPKPGIKLPSVPPVVKIPLVIVNVGCAAMILAVADDVQNKPGPPSCADVCRALDTWKETVRGGSLLRGIGNLLGCGGAIKSLEIGCACK